MLKNISISKFLIDLILAFLAAVVIEYFQLTENLLLTTLIFFIILVVILFIDYYYSSIKIINKFISFKKKSNQIKSEDFRLARFDEYYFNNLESKNILQSLKEKKNILIIGKPKAGKTRAAYEAIKKLDEFNVIKFRETLIEISDIPDRIFKGKIVIFIDDVNKYFKNLDLTELIAKLKDKSDKFIIVGTSRSGEECKVTQEVLGDYIIDFNIIKLNDITENEASNIVRNTHTDVKLDEFDGSIGSLFLGNKDMKRRFDHLEEVSKILFKMIKLLNIIGVFSPAKQILETLYLNELRRQEMKSNLMFESSLKHLKNNSFINLQNNNITPLHDSYLEFLNYNPNREDLIRLKNLLIENKYTYELYRLGLYFAKEELFDDAISCFNNVLELDPKYTAAWNDKGVVLVHLRDENEALNCYNEALKINPKNAVALLNKGSSLANTGKNDNALECFNRVIEIAPNFPEAWMHKGRMMGTLAKNKEEFNDALKALDRSIKLNEDLAEPYYEKGLVMCGLNNGEMAIRLFDKALDKDKYFLKAWLMKILVLEVDKEFDKSAECKTEMLKFFPDFNFDDSNFIINILFPRMGDAA